MTRSNVEREDFESAGRRTALFPGGIVPVGQSLSSDDGRFVLHMQPDGNLVLYSYHTDATYSALWASGTSHLSPSAYATMTPNGYLEIHDGTRKWWRPFDQPSMPRRARPNSWFAVQPDGNLVIYPEGMPSSDRAIWSSGTVVNDRRNLVAPNQLTVSVSGQIAVSFDKQIVNETGEPIAVTDGERYVTIEPNGNPVGLSTPGTVHVDTVYYEYDHTDPLRNSANTGPVRTYSPSEKVVRVQRQGAGFGLA